MTWGGDANASTTDDAAVEASGGDADGGMFDVAGAFGDGDAGSEDATADGGAADSAATDGGVVSGADETSPGSDGGMSFSSAVTRGFDGVDENPLGDRATDAFEAGTSTVDADSVEDAAAFARELADDLADLGAETRQMLRYYRDHGPGTPMDALFAAGGSEDRTAAYARNRRLRVRGLVEHVGRGRYDYRVPELLAEHTDRDEVAPFVEQVESVLESGEADAPGDAD